MDTLQAVVLSPYFILDVSSTAPESGSGGESFWSLKELRIKL